MEFKVKIKGSGTRHEIALSLLETALAALKITDESMAGTWEDPTLCYTFEDMEGETEENE